MNPVDLENMVVRHDREISDISDSLGYVVDNIATKDELKEAVSNLVTKAEFRETVDNLVTKDEFYKFEKKVDTFESEFRSEFAYLRERFKAQDIFNSEFKSDIGNLKEMVSLILEEIVNKKNNKLVK